jgi:hypothetical protein
LPFGSDSARNGTDFVPVTGTNRQASDYKISAQQQADVMQFGYARPFSFQIGRRPETKVSSVRHGVTEITLSDGRLVRATLHVKSVRADPTKPGAVDVSYNVIAEIMATPATPICDVHETIQ